MSEPGKDLITSLDEQMAPRTPRRRRSNPKFQRIAGWLLLAFSFVHQIVALNIAYDNTRTWSGISIPSDLTAAETLGEVSYQIWAAAMTLGSFIIAATLIIVGTLRDRRRD